MTKKVFMGTYMQKIKNFLMSKNTILFIRTSIGKINFLFGNKDLFLITCQKFRNLSILSLFIHIIFRKDFFWMNF